MVELFAKLLIFGELSKKNIEAVNAEDAAVADAAALAGGKDFDVAPTAVKGIAKRDNIMEVYY